MKLRKQKEYIPLRTSEGAYQRNPSQSGKKCRPDPLKCLCWGLLPIAIAGLLVLDATGIYIFNAERLLVLGIGLLILLLPCFSEIAIKSLTVRRNKEDI